MVNDIQPREELTRLTYSYSRTRQRIGMDDPSGVSATITRTGYQNYPIATLMGNGVTMTRSVMIGYTDPLEAIRTYSYAGTALAVYSPTYDPVYNKTVITELDNVTTFTYDAARQLTGEYRSGISNTGVGLVYSLVYSYDTMGNRVQMIDDGQVTAYSYNTSNQLLEVTPPTGAATTNSYDNNGNLIVQNTGGQLTTYTWDQENRLVSVAVPTSGLTTFVYSDDGHRQATITGAGTTNFVYDGDIVLQETNAIGITQVHYAQGPGTWGLLTAQNRGGTIQYYGPDDRENVRLVLSSAGAALDNNQYKAFLEQLNTPTQTNPFLGGGNVGGRQEVLNYIQFGQRLYIPALGIWLSTDMLGFAGGSQNWYQYVGNNPIMWVDPNGLSTVGPSGKDWPPKAPILPPTQWPQSPYHHLQNGMIGNYGWHCGAKIATTDNVPRPSEDAIDSCCRIHDDCSDQAQHRGKPLYKAIIDQWLCDGALCACAQNVSRHGCSAPCLEEAELIQLYYCGPDATFFSPFPNPKKKPKKCK